MIRQGKSVLFILLLTAMMFQYVNCAEDLDTGMFGDPALSNFSCEEDCFEANKDNLQIEVVGGDVLVHSNELKANISGSCNNANFHQTSIEWSIQNTGLFRVESGVCEEGRFSFDIHAVNTLAPGSYRLHLELVAEDNNERVSNPSIATATINLTKLP